MSWSGLWMSDKKVELEALRRLSEEVAAVSEELAQLIEERDRLVVELAGTFSQRVLAGVMGVGQQRVSQLVRRAR